MNILIINHYAGSPEMGMEFRPYYFAKEWTAMGHRVDIIAADFSHLRRVNPDVSRDFQEEIINGIHYHWIKTRRYEAMVDSVLLQWHSLLENCGCIQDAL